MRASKTSLDWCVKNTFSSSDDVNFGRCLLHISKMPCTDAIQGEEFRSFKLPTVFDFEKDWSELTRTEKFENYVSIYPIFDRRTTYKINAYLAAVGSMKRETRLKMSMSGTASRNNIDISMVFSRLN